MRTSVAFDVLAEHKSPIGLKLGAGGVLLSAFGYFLAPATIGALVAVALVSSSQVSAAARRRRELKRAEQLSAGMSPQRLMLMAGAASEVASAEEAET
jgi:hypothetical protein